MDETKMKIFRITFGSVLIVALFSMTLLQFMKYLDEDTNLSIKYENTYWIELPSITICILYDSGNYDQTNMTFEEFVKKINESQFNIILNANLSYTKPTFETYVCSQLPNTGCPI